MTKDYALVAFAALAALGGVAATDYRAEYMKSDAEALQKLSEDTRFHEAARDFARGVLPPFPTADPSGDTAQFVDLVKSTVEKLRGPRRGQANNNVEKGALEKKSILEQGIVAEKVAKGGYEEQVDKNPEWGRLSAVAAKYEIRGGTLSKLVKKGRVKSKRGTHNGRKAVWVLLTDVKSEAERLAHKFENKQLYKMDGDDRGDGVASLTRRIIQKR
ncbi:MAG: hypothetical protein HY716_10870 [Planctomycetes bacterium]|nr:hypothetical protein [Planctomycetota bacterium]